MANLAKQKVIIMQRKQAALVMKMPGCSIIIKELNHLKYTNLTWIVNVIFLYSFLGESIKCLQCTTLLLQRGCDTGTMEPIECRPEEKYCIKYVGELDFGKIIIISCFV